MQKPLIAPMVMFYSAIWPFVLGLLLRLRILSFPLINATSDARKLPSEQFYDIAALFFGIGSIVAIVIGVIAVCNLSKSNRLYIASLPRVQQWMIWPFHGVKKTVSGISTQYGDIQ